MDVLICSACGWPMLRDPVKLSEDCGNESCSNHREYVCKKIKLLCSFSEHKEKNHMVRITTGLPTSFKGDVGEILSVEKGYYIGTDSGWVYKVRWLECIDPSNQNKVSDIEANDAQGIIL